MRPDVAATRPVTLDRCALGPGVVHLWIVPLPQSLVVDDEMTGMLSADERERARRFAFAAPRDRFVGARVLLRRLLARYCGVAPATLGFVYSAQGKPALRDSTISFNLSHTDGLVTIAVAEGMQVGVDVERIREVPNAEALACRYFTPRERSALHGSAHDFLALWTCKEAALKATGLGISAGWDSLEIHDRRATGLGRVCHLSVLAPATGYVAAVAALGDAFRLRTFHGSSVTRTALMTEVVA